MENIITISGNVRHIITLDPGVWILDDRKVDLNTFFKKDNMVKNKLEEYTKEVSSQWDRELTEGATVPSTNISEQKFVKEKLLSGTFGIPLKPFLMNASPNENAKLLIVKTKEEEIEFNLTEGFEFILCFSKNGKPLQTDGPLHLYFCDGSNQNNPILNVKAFLIK